MTGEYRKIIALTSSLLILASMHYGVFSVIRKSQLYIDAYQNLPSVRALDEFNKLFGSSLDFKSPAGQDEIVGAYLGVLAKIISQQNDPRTIEILVGEAEKRMAPILEAKKGFNFGQNIYTLGMIYRLGAAKLQSELYYQKSIEMFNLGLEHSPNRLMFLQGLFDLYTGAGDKENAQKIDEKIKKAIAD
jgi:tetratricopeptide (TPR) repeat protein